MPASQLIRHWSDAEVHLSVDLIVFWANLAPSELSFRWQLARWATSARARSLDIPHHETSMTATIDRSMAASSGSSGRGDTAMVFQRAARKKMTSRQGASAQPLAVRDA